MHNEGSTHPPVIAIDAYGDMLARGFFTHSTWPSVGEIFRRPR